ncbi:MAG: type II secretion system F family protein [Bifidobacterium pseudocatenulatum]
MCSRPCARRTSAGTSAAAGIGDAQRRHTAGSSIPRALIAVGDIAAGEFGAGLRSAGEQLNKGVSWDDAWPDDGDLAVVRDAFASSWHSGASPVERLETAVEQLDWDERSQIEQAAAKLSVRLLLPTGLCFLPAFVAVGIIPAVMSFVG